MRVLVDLNVVLDVLLEREPHVRDAARIWRAVEGDQLDGLLAAHGLTTIFYLVTRARGRALARRVVADLLRVFRVAGVDGAVLRRALQLELPDFEDAVSSAAAEAAACDAVVTRDPAGFRSSPVEAIGPATLLARLADGVGEPRVVYGVRRRRQSRRAPA